MFRLGARIAPGHKLDMGGGKIVLRQAFRDLLPDWIVEDRQKKTFTLPLMKWLREPVWRDRLQDTLTSTKCRDRGWLAPAAVDKHLGEYFASGEESKRGWSLSQRVWQMFVLESWARAHLD